MVYAVGYKKPPGHTKFKKGNREWAKRRPNRPANHGEVFRKVMSVLVNTRGKTRSTYQNRLEIAVNNFVAAAAKGDLGAADVLLQMHEQCAEFGDMNPTILIFDEEDREL